MPKRNLPKLMGLLPQPSLEEMIEDVDQSIQSNCAGWAALEEHQNKLDQLVILRDVATAIQRTGQSNMGTAALLQYSLESIDVDATFQVPTDLKTADLNAVAMEGIIGAIKGAFTKWKEKRENLRAQETTTAKGMIGVVGKLSAKVNEASRAIQGSKNESVDLDLSPLSQWFVEQNGRVPSELAKAIQADDALVEKWCGILADTTAKHGAFVIKLMDGVDYTSDETFKKTFIDHLGELKKIHYTTILKPDPAHFVHFLGKAFLAAHPMEAQVDKMEPPQWLANALKAPPPTFSQPKTQGPQLKVTISKQTALELVKMSQAALKSTLAMLNDKSIFHLSDTVYNKQVDGYLHQAGERPEGLTGETKAYMKQNIQTPPCITLRMVNLVLASVQHRYDTARWHSQLVARLASAF